MDPYYLQLLGLSSQHSIFSQQIRIRIQKYLFALRPQAHYKRNFLTNTKAKHINIGMISSYGYGGCRPLPADSPLWGFRRTCLLAWVNATKHDQPTWVHVFPLVAKFGVDLRNRGSAADPMACTNVFTAEFTLSADNPGAWVMRTISVSISIHSSFLMLGRKFTFSRSFHNSHAVFSQSTCYDIGWYILLEQQRIMIRKRILR